MGNDGLDIPALERPSFFDGQRLTAQDLAAVQTLHRELRWLHNRSLHNWGIAFGCAVTGDAGDRSVDVEPGYAVDCLGRDLILGERTTMQVPAVSGAEGGGPRTYYLTLSYADDSMITPEMRDGECDTEGAVRRPEQPVIRWQDPTDVSGTARFRRGLDVVIATIKVEDCALARPVSAAERRDALPPAQPYVFAGATPAATTPWELWPSEDDPIGVATSVSTTEAGFRTTPQYYAQLVGVRFVEAEQGFPNGYVVEGYAQAAQPGPGGFDFRVILPRGSVVGKSKSYILTKEDVWAAAKLGIERFGAGVPNFITPDDSGVAVFLALAGVDPNTVTLSVNQPLGINLPWPLPSVELDLIPADIKPTLQKIADAEGVSVADLMAINGLSDDNLAIGVGQSLAIPSTAVPLNPDMVFKKEFLPRFQTDLQWYVVWTGVEG